MPVFLLMLIGIFLIAINTGDMLYESDKANGIERNIYNYTDSQFYWNSSYAGLQEVNITDNATEVKAIRINNLVNKGIDWMGYTFFETVKMGVETGYEGEGELKLIGLLKLLKWIFILILAYYLLMPVAAIIILAWNSYDWIKKRVIKK